MATVKTDESGAAKINVAPRSLALELLPDLQRFKPALLELLGANSPEPSQNRAETSTAANDGRRHKTDPQIENLGAKLDFGESADVRELAHGILSARRPNGGFDFGALRPFWENANRAAGVSMASQELGDWARSILGG